jgi:hypothetical protein
MNELILFSLLIFVFSTYKLYQVIRLKEAPKGNKMIAWLLYGAITLTITCVNVIFYV